MKLALNHARLTTLVALVSIVCPAIARSADNDASSANLPQQLVGAINSAFGQHPGARAIHAKGIVTEGTFTPSGEAPSVSKASHLQAPVAVTVRFSNFAGLPDVADNDPALSAPRGMAIKFQSPDGSTSDIVAHSVNGFPTSTAADFRDLFIAIGKSGPGAAKPTALDDYLGTHPAAKTFLTSAKPAPVSYGSLPYFGINTFKFTNKDGNVTYGRYQIRPVGPERYLADKEAAGEGKDYLADELRKNLPNKPIEFSLNLQVADSTDKLDDPSIVWPETRRVISLGKITVTKVVADSDAAQKELLFLPDSLPDGIDAADPMISARSGAYGVSYGYRQK